MSLAQQLLLRALIAWFWREPQHGKFVRWGTALHDRFMLPHFVWEDFSDVLADLKRSGYDFRPDWFAGAARIPLSRFWPGRTMAASRWSCVRRWSPGTCWARRARPAAPCAMSTRSVERLQVKATGFVEGRHVITCNGRGCR